MRTLCLFRRYGTNHRIYRGFRLQRFAEGEHWDATGERPADPQAHIQREVLLELYDAWLSHYGSARGIREARKHVGWALEALAISCGHPAGWIKTWRGRLVTESDPALVARGIREAFDDVEWKAAA